MTVKWHGGVMAVSGVFFDPQLTLMDSAQSFLWREYEGKYYSVIGDDPIALERTADGFRLHPVNELEQDTYLHYFDLLRDYRSLADKFADHGPIVEAMEKLPGLRVLNQPAWPVLICFILSANNNVERIRKLTWLLCEYYGETKSLDGLNLRTMPSAGVLGNVPESELRKLGMGYRAPYLIETASRVADGFDLEGLKHCSYEHAHAELVTLKGVGDKVADCVQLFGLGQGGAFPVEIWVARLMESWFPDMRGLSKAKLAKAAQAAFGDEVGIAQQFMYHCARTGLMSLQ